MKLIVICAVSVLAFLGAGTHQASASEKGCITVQGQTLCGADIPDNPTVVCTDEASCDGDAGNAPSPPDESPGVIDDDPAVGPSADPQSDPPTTTDTTETVTIPAPPASCTVNPSADVGVRFTDPSDQVTYPAGSMVDYELDVFNNSGDGECAAPDTTFTFKVPPQLELLSPAGVSSLDGPCAVTGGVGDQQIVCTFGTLEAGKHASVSVTARADKPGAATANASVGTTVSDSNVGENQQASKTVNVITSPDQSAVHQRRSQSRETVRAQGLLWDGRTFRSADEFAGWLSARGGVWERFAKNHPTAASGLNDRG